MRHLRPLLACTFLCITGLVLLCSQGLSFSSVAASVHTAMIAEGHLPPPANSIVLDSRLPVQTVSSQSNFSNVNAKFGSRFDFTISPGDASVQSGTDGIFHDNKASYMVGVIPADQQRAFVFHMGRLSRSDTYVKNEQLIQGMDTTRWLGDTTDGQGLHLVVDFIDSFAGEPGCIAIADCADAVKDDTVPVLIVGVSLQNKSMHPLKGTFIFGSNRKYSANNTCVQHITQGGTPVRVFSYDPASDASGGTLFLAGDQAHWRCDTSASDRVGLAWSYQIPVKSTSTAYLLLGGWNPSQHLFVNSTLSPASCQSEGLYAAQEWSSQDEVVDFAIDNLSTHDNLLARAQQMENYLIHNTVLTPEQRWVIGNTLRSYKVSSWLLGRRACAGGGYDATVYEGSYAFLTTVDVMHEYGYFEITRVPWFFKAALSTVFKNATSDAFGVYFQHDQGGDVDAVGDCTDPGKGIPTFRSTCYAPPRISIAVPMPTEENDDVALLLAYYEHINDDIPFLQRHLAQIEAAMQHNLRVGDPNTGIAYKDTATTFDAASDCLHNEGDGAGNLYYQGLKEATGYRAAAYLDSLAHSTRNSNRWLSAAAKIEDAMVREYNTHSFIPVASSTTFNNCSGRSITLGEGLFYLHLVGQDGTMNQQLLYDLAQQYPTDLDASTLSSPAMIVLTSSAATGPQCSANHCRRYSWFSKIILSGIVADIVYTKYGCTFCTRLDLVQSAYRYNVDFSANFADGFHDDLSDWSGHIYPRGIISWALLDPRY
ncbi:MAG: hypothetical protein JO202_14305 [Ktedonobacteraceae bacterium]|nr:hypothetical protein [Ktedonobacteraceae bacterium]